MSAIKGRTKRQDNSVTVILQARITPDIKEELNTAAELSGVSLALYIETFVQEHLRERGALPVYDLGRPRWEELPIPAA